MGRAGTRAASVSLAAATFEYAHRDVACIFNHGEFDVGLLREEFMRLEERTHAGYIEGLERARRVCEAFIRECGERFFVEEAHRGFPMLTQAKVKAPQGDSIV